MSLVVRVLVDEPAIDREFDYLVPDELVERHGADAFDIGAIVRVDLRGRRVRGWVTEVGIKPMPDVELRAITKWSSIGPPKALMDLSGWAAWRWVGTRPRFLRSASPDRNIGSLPHHEVGVPTLALLDDLSAEAFARGGAVVRLPPNADDWPLVVAAVNLGRALILTPSVDHARRLSMRLERAGIDVALFPRDWARSAAGAVTVGARGAAWAPISDLDAVLVLDEHDEGYQEESAPTWHARDVVLERARRDGAAWVIASAAPSLEALTSGAPLLIPNRSAERAGWSIIDIIDRRADDPTTGEWCSPALSEVLQGDGRVVCVLNRKGRARLAFCANCRELARGESSGAPLGLDGDRLVDHREGTDRPAVCAHCGSTRFRRVKLGVTGVAEELAAMARAEVVEVTAEQSGSLDDARILVGTEAVLHRVDRSDVVVFLDFDQELLAPRYRAGEEAMAMLIRASRLVGARSGGGRVLVQTRMPDHEVLGAARHADSRRLAISDLDTRRILSQPPISAWAIVSGKAGGEFVERLGKPDGVEVVGPADGRWRIRSSDRELLLDALGAVERPGGRLRVEVDPLRA